MWLSEAKNDRKSSYLIVESNRRNQTAPSVSFARSSQLVNIFINRVRIRHPPPHRVAPDGKISVLLHRTPVVPRPGVISLASSKFKEIALTQYDTCGWNNLHVAEYSSCAEHCGQASGSWILDIWRNWTRERPNNRSGTMTSINPLRRTFYTRSTPPHPIHGFFHSITHAPISLLAASVICPTDIRLPSPAHFGLYG